MKVSKEFLQAELKRFKADRVYCATVQSHIITEIKKKGGLPTMDILHELNYYGHEFNEVHIWTSSVEIAARLVCIRRIREEAPQVWKAIEHKTEYNEISFDVIECMLKFILEYRLNEYYTLNERDGQHLTTEIINDIVNRGFEGEGGLVL